MNRTCAFLIRIIPIVLFASIGCRRGPELDADAKSGRELAKAQCARCHVFPDADQLPRGAWGEVLNRMGMYLGHDDLKYAATMKSGTEEDKRNLRIQVNAEFIAPAPLVSPADWKKIRHYFDQASVREEAATARVNWEPAKLFTTVYSEFNPDDAVITAIRIDTKGKRILAGESRHKSLVEIAPDGRIVSRHAVDGEPVTIQPTADGVYIAYAGTLFPSDEEKAFVELRQSSALAENRIVLSKLKRTAHASFADINGDGITDILVGQFGHHKGRLSLFTSHKDGRKEPTFTEQRLHERSGSIQTAFMDFDGDGKLIPAALFGQAREGFSIFREKNGSFEEKHLREDSPAFGNVRFAVGDLNNDGQSEIVIANGDNGDITNGPLRSYHGVRVYSRDREKLEEEFFFPLHGAYGVCLADFNGDGRTDIAVNAFYPDFAAADPLGFAVLLNQGRFSFRPVKFPESSQGRWLVMDCGDLDGDGAADVVLGGAYDEHLSGHDIQKWVQSPGYAYKRAVIVLKGTQRK